MKLRNKRLLITAIFSLTVFSSCKKNTEADQQQQIKLIETYLQNLKDGKISEAAANIHFTDAEVEAGFPELFCDAMEGYDYSKYTINGIEPINNSISMAKVIVNTNFDSADKANYIDVEFNPYVILYQDTYMLALIKEQVPQCLYEELEELPDNYDDNVDYIVIKEGDIILK